MLGYVYHGFRYSSGDFPQLCEFLPQAAVPGFLGSAEDRSPVFHHQGVTMLQQNHGFKASWVRLSIQSTVDHRFPIDERFISSGYTISIYVYIYIYNKLYTMPSSIPKLVQPHLGPPWGVLHSHAMVAPSTLAAHVGGDGRYCKALADPDCTKIIHKSVGQWVVITEYI